MGCTKSKDRHTVGRSCLFWSSVFATICPLKNPTNFGILMTSFFTSASSCIVICLFSCIWRRQFSVESACISLFPCVSSYSWIHFPSSVLSVLSTSSVVVHSFLRKRMFSFIFMTEITRVVVLYTILRFVEGVYKPQRACVGWASVTESCLEAYMWIKRTCLDEFPPGHPKMFGRTLDIISLFVLAISNTINLYRNFFVLFPMKTLLGKWNYFTQTVQI